TFGAWLKCLAIQPKATPATIRFSYTFLKAGGAGDKKFLRPVPRNFIQHSNNPIPFPAQAI
ncbi:MAG: hypothetical protein ABJA66_18240, partial [Actinomycetota bacterium]